MYKYMVFINIYLIVIFIPLNFITACMYFYPPKIKLKTNLNSRKKYGRLTSLINEIKKKKTNDSFITENRVRKVIENSNIF